MAQLGADDHLRELPRVVAEVVAHPRVEVPLEQVADPRRPVVPGSQHRQVPERVGDHPGADVGLHAGHEVPDQPVDQVDVVAVIDLLAGRLDLTAPRPEILEEVPQRAVQLREIGAGRGRARARGLHGSAPLDEILDPLQEPGRPAGLGFRGFRRLGVGRWLPGFERLLERLLEPLDRLPVGLAVAFDQATQARAHGAQGILEQPPEHEVVVGADDRAAGHAGEHLDVAQKMVLGQRGEDAEMEEGGAKAAPGERQAELAGGHRAHHVRLPTEKLLE